MLQLLNMPICLAPTHTHAQKRSEMGTRVFAFLSGNFSLTSERYLLGVRRGVFWLLIDDKGRSLLQRVAACVHQTGCTAKLVATNGAVWTCVDHPFNGRLITVFITSGDYQIANWQIAATTTTIARTCKSTSRCHQGLLHQNASSCIQTHSHTHICPHKYLQFVWSFHHPAVGYASSCGPTHPA